MGRNLSTVPYVQEGQAVSAAWANQLVRELRNQPAYVAQMQIPKPPDFKPPCAFGYVYRKDGDYFLQSGVVIGGESNDVSDDIELSKNATDGTFIFLKVTFRANRADGLLLGGVDDIVSVEVMEESTIPNNQIPKSSNPQGIIHIPLGQYRDKVFLPYGCGNFVITHCPGSIGYLRDYYE